MSLADIATIFVSSAGAGVTRQGYGVGMITSFTAAWAERFRTYSNLAAVALDFPANTPEYLAAQSYFSANPAPPQVMIGRCSFQPTQQFLIAVPTGAALPGQGYAARVAVATGVVFPSQLATYTPVIGAAPTGTAGGWSPLAFYSKGNLIAGGASSIYSCMGLSGPSGLGQAAFAGFTGGAGSSIPTVAGVGSITQDGTLFWQNVGLGGPGAVTNDAVVLGLKAALEALAAPVVVGSAANQLNASTVGAAGSLSLQLKANQPAKFFGVQVKNRAALSLAQTEADPGIATDLAAIKLASTAWYGLITTFNSSAIITAAAGWVEANTKLYPAASQDTAVVTASEGASATDIAHSLKAAGYARSWIFAHPSNDEFPDAGEIGKFFPINPGGETWRMKSLPGVTAEGYSDNEQSNCKAKYAHFYYDIGGRFVIGGDGKSSSGNYIDVVRGLDWYTANLQADIADLAIAVNKIPFTNPGIDLIEGKVRARNEAGIRTGLIAAYPAPIVIAPDVTQISATDKGNRELGGVTTTWVLAGAIHHTTVTVVANQ